MQKYALNIFSKLDNWKNCSKGSGVPIGCLEAKIHKKSTPDFRNALRQRPALNDFLGIFQMQPLFPESGTQWPFQFAKDGIWMYGGCFLGCETSGEPPSHRSTQCIGGSRLSHSIGHKHRWNPSILSSGLPRRIVFVSLRRIKSSKRWLLRWCV